MRGRTAIVTGASRGIGLSIAARLLARGANVCITARNAEPLVAAAAELGVPERVLCVAGNASDPDHRAEAVEATVARYGAVDFLVNNTGINPAYGPLVQTDLGAFAKTLETNLVGTLGWIQETHAASMGRRGGAVVNVASAAGLRAAPLLGAYGASKAAVVHLTQQLALELSPAIRVNAVAPAVVRTRFAARLFEGHEPAVAERYPLRRLGEPGDVAGAVAFLLSDEADWITGQTLALDGGLLTTGGVEE